MFFVHTANFTAFMSSTLAFLVATLVTNKGKVSFILNQHTGDFLCFEATPARYIRCASAGATFSFMTEVLTCVNEIMRTTRKGLSTGLPTRRYRICARFSVHTT